MITMPGKTAARQLAGIITYERKDMKLLSDSLE
jgi:hypothetical protein